jgi:hypothetical protein
LHNEEFHDLHFSPDTVKIMKSWWIGWAGRVPHIGEKRNSYKVLVRKLEDNNKIGW